MIYRRLSPTGDYTFGAGKQEFLSGVEAVAQAIKTRLQLNKYTFWRDLKDGFPLFTNILGSPGSDANLAIIDTIVKDRISSTPNVIAITAFNRVWNPNTRNYSYTTTVSTIYSQTATIAGTL